MKIVFFGTPEFALPALSHVAAEHEILLAVTAPPRPRGRGQRLGLSPVGRCAEELGIPLLMPSRLDPQAVETILGTGAQAACVVAYGKILPASLFDRIPCLNVHPSLLPRHRGAAPVPWTIWSGDREAGVTIMRIVRELDAGPIYLQEAWPLQGDETAGELLGHAAARGAQLLCEALRRLAAGDLPAGPQEGQATYARTLQPEDERLDFSQGAETLARQVRALSPRPGVHVEVLGRGVTLRLLRALAAPGNLAPGLLDLDLQGLRVGTGEGLLVVTELQPAGGRPQTAAELLRGRPWLRGLQVR